MPYYISASSASSQGLLHALPHWASSSLSLWQTVFRPKTPDWRLNLTRLPVSDVGCVYIISQCPHIPVVTYVTCFWLFTQVCPTITLFTQLEHPALSKVNMQHSSVLETSDISTRDTLSVMVIIVGNGTSSSSSNLRGGCLHFPLALMSLRKTWIHLFSS